MSAGTKAAPVFMERALPANVEAEKAILGAIFLDNAAYYSCENLSADDFTIETHRRIYRAMVQLVEDSKPIDFVTVCDILGNKEVIYVTNITDGLPRAKNVTQYVDMVLDAAQRRQFILTMARGLDNAYDGDITEVIAQTDNDILEIGHSSKKSRPKPVRDVTPRLYAEVARIQAMDDSRAAIGYRTGMDRLDNFVKGYHKGELAIIGGYTADGKTSLMKQGVLASVMDGVKSLVFSGEMTDEQLLMSMMAPMSKIKYAHLRDGRLMDMLEREEFPKLKPMMDSWPLWIDDATGLHIREVCARARAFIRREGVEIVFLDHTGKYHADGERHDLQVTNLVRGLSGLAKTENIPVIALHQLSRPEKGIKRRPRLSDLKDSGGVEQEAHTVMFVYRPVDKDDEFTEFDEIVIAKQRHGETGMVRSKYNKDALMFEAR